MRQLSNELSSHISSSATNLAKCWRIKRLDGIELGFSDHDETLEFDGSVFTPTYGADSGEVASKLGAQTDSAEIVGIVNSAAINEDDILLGRYDGAKVESFLVNWKDVSERHHLRTDYIGEITRIDGIFKAELRSAQVDMNIAKGKVYQSFCNARLGENPCGIDIEDPNYKISVTVLSLDNSFTITTSLISGFANNWFSFGKAVWLSGKREGKSDIIILHKNESAKSVISFSEPIIDWVNVGDNLNLYAGCDRHLSTCQDKFSNVVNFQGFPHIPGSDFILRYPKQGNSLNGQPLFT